MQLSSTNSHRLLEPWSSDSEGCPFRLLYKVLNNGHYGPATAGDCDLSNPLSELSPL
jgi:hypothetical protein